MESFLFPSIQWIVRLFHGSMHIYLYIYIHILLLIYRHILLEEEIDATHFLTRTISRSWGEDACQPGKTPGYIRRPPSWLLLLHKFCSRAIQKACDDTENSPRKPSTTEGKKKIDGRWHRCRLVCLRRPLLFLVLQRRNARIL